jgi:hypothetical protein
MSISSSTEVKSGAYISVPVPVPPLLLDSKSGTKSLRVSNNLVSANVCVPAPFSSIKRLLTTTAALLLLLLVRPSLALFIVPVANLLELENKEEEEDEHSDLRPEEEEEPFDLIANETGAHFTHPVAQKRGLIPTSLDICVGEEKLTASILDADTKLVAALIASISLSVCLSVYECVSLSFVRSQNVSYLYFLHREKTIIKDFLVSNKIQHVFCLSNSLFLYSACNRRSVSFLLGIKTRKKLLLHRWSKDSENRGGTRLGTPGYNNYKLQITPPLVALPCLLAFFLSFFLGFFCVCVVFVSPLSVFSLLI